MEAVGRSWRGRLLGVEKADAAGEGRCRVRSGRVGDVVSGRTQRVWEGRLRAHVADGDAVEGVLTEVAHQDRTTLNWLTVENADGIGCMTSVPKVGGKSLW